MKVLAFVMFLLVGFTTFAEELKEKKYYEVDKVTVAEDCSAYPVIKMIEAYRQENLDEAKKYFTEGYIKYVERYVTGGLQHLMEDYSKDMDLSKDPLRFKFYPHKSGDMTVKVLFTTKSGAGAVKKYRVKKNDGKWLLVAWE